MSEKLIPKTATQMDGWRKWDVQDIEISTRKFSLTSLTFSVIMAPFTATWDKMGTRGRTGIIISVAIKETSAKH